MTRVTDLADLDWEDFFAEDCPIDNGDKAALLRSFVRGSNEVEGIFRTPSRTEIAAHVSFLMADEVTIDLIVQFVRAIEPTAKLRIGNGMNVTVGNHVPPAGGPGIGYALAELAAEIDTENICPFGFHHDYLDLHPFTDGNGRSSRVIWLRQYGPRGLALPFLQRWYYHTLSKVRA